MIQRRCRLRLADKTVHSVAVIGEFRRQDLEGDFTIERRILRQIHLGHPAFAEWRQDSVLLDDGVRGERLHTTSVWPSRRSATARRGASAYRAASYPPTSATNADSS